MKKIECIILDWAGTAVDYGCFAPVAAFIESFNEIGVPVTAAETRAYMGLTKIEEIRALFNRLLSARSSVATTPMRTCRPVTWLFSACCLTPWKIIPNRYPAWWIP